jgi:hypothetical protein
MSTTAIAAALLFDTIRVTAFFNAHGPALAQETFFALCAIFPVFPVIDHATLY